MMSSFASPRPLSSKVIFWLTPLDSLHSDDVINGQCLTRLINLFLVACGTGREIPHAVLGSRALLFSDQLRLWGTFCRCTFVPPRQGCRPLGRCCPFEGDRADTQFTSHFVTCASQMPLIGFFLLLLFNNTSLFKFISRYLIYQMISN